MATSFPEENDPSFLVNQPIKDFCFDLHDATRRSHIGEDIKRLYEVEFKELSEKYCDKQAWPAANLISSQCIGVDGPDTLFLSFYTEMVFRHIFARLKPTLEQRLEAWKNYVVLFDKLLSLEDTSTQLTPQWIFDILHEFVYQFQSFCQYRTQPRLTEERESLEAEKDAWNISAVSSYLYRFIQVASVSNKSEAPSMLHYYAGYYSVAVMSRLQCLVCDFEGSVSVLDTVPNGTESEVFTEIFSCRLSVYYHLGFALLMLRRFVDAAKTLDAVVSQLARISKAGGGGNSSSFARGGLPASSPPPDQVQKTFDRMLALLTVAVGLAPSGTYRLDDISSQCMKEKYSDKLSLIERGTDTTVFETILLNSAPKLVSPAVPDYASLEQTSSEAQSSPAAAATASPAGSGAPSSPSKNGSKSALQHDAYSQQIKLFNAEVVQQRKLAKIRSYLKLYTSIGVDKLARFNDVDDTGTFKALLAGLKHKIPDDSTVHFYVDKDMVYVDEPNSSAQDDKATEEFFMEQIHKYDQNIKTLLASTSTASQRTPQPHSSRTPADTSSD